MKLPGKSLGVDFSEGRIHFVLLRRMFGAPRAARSTTLDLTGASDEGDVVGRLTEFVQEQSLRSRRVVAGIPMRDSMVRFLELPAVEDKHLRQMLGFELDRHFPLGADELYYDYRVLTQTDDHVKLLVVAIEKRILDRYRSLLLDAGLPTSSMTVNLLADLDLVRSHLTSHQEEMGTDGNEVSAFLRQNPSGLEVAVMEQMEPTGLFRFPVTNGEADPDSAATAGIAIRALRQSCVTALGGSRPSVVITAGRAVSDEMQDELRESLQLTRIAPLEMPAPLSDAQDPNLATAYGLASAGLDGALSLPNLLPEEQRSGDSGAGFFVLGAQVLVVLLLAAALVAGDLVHEQRQLASLESQLAAVQPDVDLIRGQEEKIRAEEDLLASFNSSDAAQVSPLDVVRETTRMLANMGSWVTDFTLKDVKGQPVVTITGRAKENEGVQDLKISLDEHEMFEDVQETSPTRKEKRSNLWKFKISGNLSSREVQP